MATFPLGDIERWEEVGTVTGSSRGTTITANASNNTKATSYTQLIASTVVRADGIMIVLEAGVTIIDYLIDIAVGASSSEVNIINNLIASGGSGAENNYVYFFPLSIPAGSRISARCQASTGSSAINIACYLFSGGMAQPEGQTIVDTYGAATGDSGGTSVDPGGSINTKSGYSQIVASTTRPHRWIALAIGNQLNGTRTTCRWLIDIGIGPATETVLISNIATGCHATFDSIIPNVYFLPVTIPAGTRLTVRAQCSINDATDRLFDAIIYAGG